MTPDAELVARSRRRDPEAFGALVERHQRMVVGVALARCGDAALAEDIAQEAFVAAWRDLDQLRDGERIGSWVAGIARNLATSAARTQARRDGATGLVPVLVQTPEDAAVEREDRELLQRALADVPETHREVLVRYYLGGESVAAIAAALGAREDLVKQRLSRGRRTLRDGVLARVDSALERTRSRRLGRKLVFIMTTKKVAIAAVAIVLAIVGATAWHLHDHAVEPAPRATAPAPPPPPPASLHVRKLADPGARTAMLEAIRAKRAQRAATPASDGSAAAGSGTTAPALPAPTDEQKAYISTAVRELRPLVDECYHQGRARDPNLGGTVAVDFTLEGDPEIGGVVGDSTIVDEASTITDPGVRECIQQTMYALQMDPPSGGPVRVRNTFLFLGD